VDAINRDGRFQGLRLVAAIAVSAPSNQE